MADSILPFGNRIFPVEEAKIVCEHRDFPSHWARIGGCDFGWTHPFAAVELVHDRDSDVVYVSRCHRLKEASPIEHAAAIRSWGKDLPWAWPRDGKRETLEGAGIALAEQYRDQGRTNTRSSRMAACQSKPA